MRPSARRRECRTHPVHNVYRPGPLPHVGMRQHAGGVSVAGTIGPCTMTESESFNAKDVLRLVATVAWLIVFVFQPRLTLAVTLLLIGSAFIAFNAMILVGRIRGHVDGPSVAPIFGGVIAGIGVAMLPLSGAWHWAWVPLLLDWGGAPMFIYGGLRHLLVRKSGR